MLKSFGSILVVAALATHTAVGADDIKPPPTTAAAALVDVGALIRSAHQQAGHAKTIDDLDGVLALCQRLGQVGLTPRAESYVNKLASWTHNRRGEQVAAEASAAAQVGDAQRAESLERQALADFEAAVRLDPEAWKPVHNRGVSYAQAGRFEAAIGDFTATIKRHPRYANAWFNRAEVRSQQQQYQRAIDDYSRALRLRKDDAEILAARGRAWAALHGYAPAAADFDKAVRLQPDDAQIYVDRAAVHAARGRWEDAAKDYRKAIQLDPDLGRAYQGAAWLMATCPDVRLRDPELALRCAGKAIALDGTDNGAYLDTLAAAQAASGDYQQAQATLNQAIQPANETDATRLRQRLQLYQAGRPYRDAAVNPSPTRSDDKSHPLPRFR